MKLFTLRLFSLLLILMGLDAQAQRTCASHEHLLQQMSQHPEMVKNRKKMEQFAKQYELQQATAQKTTVAIYNIPVVVHVLYNTAAQNISDAQILSQIAVLNADFQKLNTDASLVPSAFSGLAADCQIQFCMAQRTPTGAATTGIIRKSTTMTSFSADNDNAKYSSMGGDDAWPSSQYLNLWVVPSITSGGQPGILGYAQFPGGPATTDGVVIGYNYFGNTGTVSSPYNKGRTATHEVGHWLNLYHIWGDDGTACTGSDLVGDTPNQGGENYGCPTFPHVSCSNGPNGDMFMNYMDYTDDACMYMFSSGQKTRMHAVLTTGGARASLASSLGCVAPTASTCGTVTGTNSTAITTTSATINWTAVTGATSYNLQWKATAATTWTTVTGLTTASYNLTGLTASTSYNVQIQAVCAAGTATYSTPISFTTTANTTTCNAPTSLATSATTSSATTINWAAVTGATGYNLQWKLNTAITWTTVSNLTTTNYNLTGLAASTAYNVQVQAICSSTATSAFSTVVNFTTTAATATCAVPTGLAVGTTTSSTASITWAAVTGATGHNLQWKLNTATTWTTVSNLTTTSYILTGLTASTTYNVRVQTICSSSLTSAYTTAINCTTTAATAGCPVPTGLAASNITTNMANITWTAVLGATSYKLQWRKTGTTTWTTVSNITTPSYALTGLIAATSYEVQVMTVCATASLYTSVMSFTTASCLAPTGLASSAITINAATVSWSPISGATSYKLQYRKSTATSWTTVSNIVGTSYSLTGLAIGTSYTFQVATTCSATTTSVYSTTATFTTVAACPDNYESNNTISAATLISANTAVTAKIGTSTDKDYFKFTNSATAPNIKINLTNLPLDYDVKLYAANGTNLLGSSLNLGTASETIVYNTAVIGTYYVYVYGYNSVFDNVNCYTLNAQTSAATFKTVMNTNTAKKEANTSLELFPNPANSEVNFTYAAEVAQTAVWQIFDPSGKVIQEQNIALEEGVNQVKIVLNEMPMGLYVVRLVTAEGTSTSRLMVQH